MSQTAETWIVPEAQRMLTPNRYRAKDPRVCPVDLFLFHYTAGGDSPLPPRVKRWNASPGGASTHLMVSRNPAKDPTIQLAPFEDRTWHAGKGATWRGATGVNVRSIGIDVDNLGFLEKRGGAYVNAYGGAYNGPAPFIDDHGRAWEPYREESIRELCAHLRRLADLFPIVRTDWDRLLPHSAVKAGKSDTGPAFPWPEVFAAVGLHHANG